MDIYTGSSYGSEIPVLTSSQMRSLDMLAIKDFGIPGIVLMENAACGVVKACEHLMGDLNDKRILIVCGGGNNGGDGFAVARQLYNKSGSVDIAYFGNISKTSVDTLTNINAVKKLGIYVSDEIDTDAKYDLVIDALLGTGTKGELKPEYKKIISVMNNIDAVKVAVDIPSGVNADTGEVSSVAFNADLTVTFALPKIGVVTYPGAAYAGVLIVEDITIPLDVAAESCSVFVIRNIPNAFNSVIRSCIDGHKGTFGHALIIAGSKGMTGAAALCARAASACGAGLVTAAVPNTLNEILEIKLTEQMTLPVSEFNSAFGRCSLDEILSFSERSDFVVIGPGLGRSEETISFCLDIIPKINKPMVIDADALYALSKDVNILKNCKSDIIITPHLGEMARLMGVTIDKVSSDRVGVARRFAAEYGVSVVLKGAGTICSRSDGFTIINTTGTPAMASGGSGDVLSGMIAGISCVMGSLSSYQAVYFHGRAGELAEKKYSAASVTASHIIDNIGEAIKLEEDPDSN